MPPAPDSLLDPLLLQGPEVERRRALAGFSAADSECLLRCGPVVQPRLDALISRFLGQQLQIPEIAAVIAAAASPAEMQRHLTAYAQRLFCGEYGESYAGDRLKIGFVHRRMGLAARFFLAALHHLGVALRAAVEAAVADPDEAARVTAALERLLLFDVSLVVDAYEHRLAAEARRESDRALRYASSLEAEVAARTRELEQLSRTDALTGLGNRRAFREELLREISRAQRQDRPLGALYIDVDDFKRLNDCEGHKRGDDALVAVAAALGDTLREIDVAARVGGDEFCVLLPDTGLEQTTAVGERLRERVRVSCPVTVSVGAAVLEDGDTAEPDALLARADAAMYKDKRRAAAKTDPTVRLAG